MEFPIINSDRQWVNNFINGIAPLVCEEYLKRKSNGEKVVTPATVIAQACLESGYNLNASTLFGIKGDGVTSSTTEFVNGNYVNITASFKYYPNIASAVTGYYDLMQWNNYDDVTSATTVQDEVKGLTNDIGYAYATDPDYYDKIMSIVETNNLYVFNDYVHSYNFDTPQDENDFNSNVTGTKTAEELADEVYLGLWGVMPERKERLEAAGRDYEAIRTIVNSKYYGIENKKTVDELADEIWRGEWGDNPERRERLEADGYDYEAVQHRVMEKYYNG